MWVRAAALGKMERLEEARAGCLAALDVLGDQQVGYRDAIHDTLAEIALAAGEFEAAIEECERALARNCRL